MINKFQVNVGGFTELQNLVLDHAKKLGYPVNITTLVKTYAKYYQFNLFKIKEITYSGAIYDEENLEEISIVEFLNIKVVQKVQLTHNSLAIIDNNGITITRNGTFSFEKLNELVEAAKTFKDQ